jgi:signal transduction histidine kinase
VTLRTKIFLLSTATTVAAIAAMGIAGLASGRSAIVRSALDSLEREMGSELAALESTKRAMQTLAEAFPGNTLYAVETISSLRTFLSSRGPEILGAGTELELRLTSGERIFILGSLNGEAGLRDRQEFESAARGPSYLIRRTKEGPAIFYAAPARIGDVEIVACAAARVGTLDYFERFQLAMLGAASVAALLLVASYLLSRLIARKLDEGFKRMSDAIRGQIERLEADKADRQAFIDDLTHELRTPVTSIVGFAELLRSRSWDEALFADCLGRIEAEGRRILDLSESLKRLLIARTGTRDFEEVDVPDFLRSIAREAEPVAEAARASLEVEAEACVLRLDRPLMSIALRNLIENSARASPPGSRIVLGFARDGGAPRFFVRDWGAGMSEAQLARAGRPFPRTRAGGAAEPGADRGADRGGGEAPRAPGEGGFGLGLAICKEVADRHGARLEFERPAGGGLVVSLKFPNLRSVYAADTGS